MGEPDRRNITNGRNAAELLEAAVSGNISPEDFEHELRALSKGHQRRGRKYKTGDLKVYRTRIWRGSDRPANSADLSYPPVDVSPLGRANLQGEPIFYASAGLPPSFVECRLALGHQVVCSEWRNTSDVVLQEVGLIDGQNTSELDRVYDEMFTLTDPAMYAYSARVARHLLSGDPISGLLYRSMAAQNQSQNVALKPAFVDSGLRLINASFYDIKNVRPSFQYDVEEIDFAQPNPDGLLTWKGRKRQWVIREKGAELKMVSNGWSWEAYDPAGHLVDPE